MLRISTSASRTRKTPATTSASWLMKSMTASTTFTLTASLTPRTLTSASTTIRVMPSTMSPGGVVNQSKATPPA
jgi:hypothetical protein